MRRVFECDQCKTTVVHNSTFTTGYGYNAKDEKICFDCCAVNDRHSMIEDGDSKRLPLYLNKKPISKNGLFYQWKITNWPGTLVFTAYCSKNGRHNLAGKRIDVWFRGPDGHVWHGWQVGDSTTIVHCKRTREIY